MTATVSKWGNSLALRIPAGVAKALDLKEQTAVEMNVEDGRLIVRPVARRRYDLDTLLRGVTPENRHDEISTGARVGNEVW